MSLYGALFSGVSGLQSQSSAMGAIADNVTNVNTVGYKRTETQFQTLVTKQVSLTSYAPGGVQATPRSGVDVQGLLQSSTSATDIAISGDGFFIVNEAANPESGDIFAYTRAGSFKVDKDGYLQNASGWYLEGWPLQTWDNSTQASTVTVGEDTYMKSYTNDAGDTVYVNDNIVDSTNLKPLNLNTIGGTATATTTVAMGLNLPAGDSVGDSHKTDVQFFDSLGNPHNINHTWVKRASNAWDFYAIPPAGSTTFAIEDQTSARNTYFSSGRLDFETIPDTNTSMTMDVDGTTYTINFTTADDSDVGVQQLQLTALPADGETFRVTIDGTNYDFEFDSDSSVSSGNTAVTIGANTTSTASNLASAIQSAMESAMGTATWASASGSIITIPRTNAYAVSFTDSTGGDVNIGISGNDVDYTVDVTNLSDNDLLSFSYGGTTYTVGFHQTATSVTGADAVIDFNATATNTNTEIQTAIKALLDANLFGGTATYTTVATDTISITGMTGDIAIFDRATNAAAFTQTANDTVDETLQINVQNRSLSQVMDELGDRMQSIFQYEFGGTPSSPPSAWAERLAGENSVYFVQGSSANSITVDASGVTTSGVSAVVQDSAYTVSALDGAVAWTGTSNYAVEFNGDGTPDKFFGADEATASDPRLQYKIGWANGASDMDGSTTPALSVSLGNYNTTDGLTQFSGSYQINYISQNGASFGNFAGVSVGQDGIVTALFDNGVTKPAFMVPIATMVNPNGMESRSGNVWVETDGSGQPTVREAGAGGAGSIASAALEASTVDIGEEFTNMITTQRAYSAATKIITTADQMLEELMRVK